MYVYRIILVVNVEIETKVKMCDIMRSMKIKMIIEYYSLS